ncbi:hypothetical protein GLOIN_2v1773502 [Rhizophagus irregularis DAOM 181602=DAOM 197198]|nr:hypothetical protein GLOIN_2v1773502 [Rhizophagus irregularis DAOM 181602=DAOM 197198]
MFHSDYKHIIDRLPESLVKRACQRLLHHSKDPVPLESISKKSERIESYLRRILEVYENSLNKKKRKTMTHEIKNIAPSKLARICKCWRQKKELASMKSNSIH